MRILCTHPGKYGDSLWAMPTVRAIAHANDGPVDLLLSPNYSSHADLLRAQDYIDNVRVWPHWQVQNTAPMTPWSPFEETLHHEAIQLEEGTALRDRYDAVVHLGYREWPRQTLPEETYYTARRNYVTLPIAPLDLTTPWITTLAAPPIDRLIVAGFSEQHFELKRGLVRLLRYRFPRLIDYSSGPRHSAELGAAAVSWGDTTRAFTRATVAVCCCSALHVLACAVGTPVVMMEPDPDRHNDVFFPYGKVGPEVTLVLGGDGKPTFDARHVGDAIDAHLSR